MSLLSTVTAMVRGYPGGTAAVALRLGKSEATLNKELRGAPGFKLGLEDADQIAAMCHEVRLPDALLLAGRMAETVDAVVVPMAGLPEGDLLPQDLARLLKEAADVVEASTAGAADKRWTPNEVRALSKEINELIGVAQALRRCAEGDLRGDLRRGA